MCKFVRLLVPWDSVTHDLMPVVGPHDDELAKVLQMGAESTFGNCIGVQAELSNTLALYKMMQNESERYETHEPAFYYHTERCRSREQSHACMSYAETRQRVRSQHLGCTAKCFVYNVSQAKTLPESGYFLRFGSEVQWTSSSYGEDWVDDSKFIYSDTNHIGIYQFNGKERDFESGFYYYGARYHWPELWTGWTSPDPLMDKYPGISPYNYCNWNPVIFIDPDGRDGVCVVDEQNKTLTIRADYYVRCGSNSRLSNREMSHFYKTSEVNRMEKRINTVLQNAGYTVTEGDYAGYDVKFDLHFIAVENNDIEWPNINMDSYENGIPIGNTIEKRADGKFFRGKNGEIQGGKTQKNKYIIMNSKFDYTRDRIHEIFHTLFYSNDDAPNGIGNYNPGTDYPNQEDINNLINNDFLRKIQKNGP